MKTKTIRNIAVALAISFGMVSCATPTGMTPRKAEAAGPVQEQAVEEQAKPLLDETAKVAIAVGAVAALLVIPFVAGTLGSLNLN